nr:L,D-transpeptidase family protein [uncultured Sphingosinicella sp.]
MADPVTMLVAALLLTSSASELSLTSAPTVEQAERLLIDKSDRTLAVFFADGRVHTLKELRFGPTWNQGPKRQRGDRKTPEGEYQVLEHRTSRIDYPDVTFLPALYLDYPNEADLAASEALGVDPGDAIMIHGPHPDIPAHIMREHWTDGCAALSREQMAYLMIVTSEGTRVTIQP